MPMGVRRVNQGLHLRLGLYGTRHKRASGPTPSVVPAITPLTYIYPGTVLTCSAGTWSGTPTITFQWYLDGVLVVGAAAATYTPLVADIGKAPTCQVTATVTSGSTIVTASTTEVIRWSPAALSNKVLWLDASVASSITSAAGLVSQWNDLSGGGNHAVQATGAAQPTLSVADAAWNNRNIVRFNGTSAFMTGALALSGLPLTIGQPFIMQNAGSSSSRIMTFGTGAAGDTASGAFFVGRNSTSAVYRAMAGPSGTLDPKTVSYNQTTQITMEKTATGVKNNLNGTTSIEVANTMALTTTVFAIGVGYTTAGAISTAFYAGDLPEFVVIAGVISATERDKLAGYFAWKWGPVGLVARLDASNPYKTVFP